MGIRISTDEPLDIPAGVRDFASFRSWTWSDEFPERGRIDWLAGRIEATMSPEELYTHGALIVEIAARLHALIIDTGLGLVFSQRTRIASPAAELSVEPDVVAVLWASSSTGRVHDVPSPKREERYIELEGGAGPRRRSGERQLGRQGPQAAAAALRCGGCARAVARRRPAPNTLVPGARAERGRLPRAASRRWGLDGLAAPRPPGAARRPPRPPPELPARARGSARRVTRWTRAASVPGLPRHLAQRDAVVPCPRRLPPSGASEEPHEPSRLDRRALPHPG